MIELLGNKYKAIEYRSGNILITRKSDQMSVYLQGDDAVEFIDNHRILGTSEYPSGPFKTLAEHIDACLSDYDEVMS